MRLATTLDAIPVTTKLLNSCAASLKPNVKSLFIRPVKYTRQITWPLFSIIDFIKINTMSATSGAETCFPSEYLRSPKQKSITRKASKINYLVLQTFDFHLTWWRVSQKRVVRAKLDIHVFLYINQWRFNNSSPNIQHNDNFIEGKSKYTIWSSQRWLSWFIIVTIRSFAHSRFITRVTRRVSQEEQDCLPFQSTCVHPCF